MIRGIQTVARLLRDVFVRWQAIPLHRRVSYLRWSTPPVVVLLVALHEFVGYLFFEGPEYFWHAAFKWMVYGFTGIVVSWLGLTWIARAIARQEQDAAKLQQAYADLEAIQRQLLSIHDIGREMVGAVDPLQVLELAVRAPVQLAGARSAAVFTFDDDQKQLRLDITWGLSDRYVQALHHHVDKGISAERCRRCRPLTARVTQDCPLFDGLQGQAQMDGIHSLVCLPLTRNQERVGIITGYFAAPEGPPEAQLRLLNIVATEIASSLQVVRLRARQMATLTTVGQIAQTSADLDTFLDQTLTAILENWGLEAGSIFLHEPTSGAWHSRAQRGLGNDSGDARFGLAISLSEKARASTRVAFSSPDMSTQFAFAVAVPLLAEGTFLGALFLASTRAQALSPRQIPFLTLLAHQTALAVRNAQLHLQLGHLAVLEERFRISREMHDGLAQTLSYVGWQMDHLEMLRESGRLDLLASELGEARRTVREVYLDVREAIDGLRLATDQPGGLPAALREYLSDFSKRTNIAAEFEMNGDESLLEPATELQFMRIAQEALTNVRKHSGAQHVWVRLEQEADQCKLIVADDGRGFDPSMPRTRQHLGMGIMRERTSGLGGSLTIATGSGQGTRITAIAPKGEGRRQKAEG